MANLTKYSKGKRMVREDKIKQIDENTQEIVDLKEDLQGKVNSYVVTDIKALTSDFINKLKSGDVVVKQTGSGQHPQYHSYRVSFMKDNEGICLTYTDASCSETVSYDKSGNNWVYNSTDLTQFDKIVEVIEPQGTEEQATGLKINGVDYKVGGGADLYEHKLYIHLGPSQSSGERIETTVIFYSTEGTEYTLNTISQMPYAIRDKHIFGGANRFTSSEFRIYKEKNLSEVLSTRVLSYFTLTSTSYQSETFSSSQLYFKDTVTQIL